MYTKVIFETAGEFFNACQRHRMEGDTSPVVPSTVYVVFEGEEAPYLAGEGAENFGLGDITQTDMIEAAFKYAGSKVNLSGGYGCPLAEDDQDRRRRGKD